MKEPNHLKQKRMSKAKNEAERHEELMTLLSPIALWAQREINKQDIEHQKQYLFNKALQEQEAKKKKSNLTTTPPIIGADGKPVVGEA